MQPFIEAVILQTIDYKTLIDFYRSGFDLPEPKKFGEDHFGFPITPYFGFDIVTSIEKTGNTVIWFKVDDIYDRYQKLVKLGATENMKPNQEQSPNEILATLSDPEGNKLGLIQVLSKG